LLIDANLPDGNGRDLLHALRMRAPATPALAHTASRDRGDLDALVDAGFAEVLIKPLAAAELQAAVRRALQLQPAPAESMARRCGKLPVWDDAAAAAALDGNHAHVAALRTLFLVELPAQRDAVLGALLADDAVTALANLHRLQASCGFVGAARLGEAVGTLQVSPASARARDDFAHAVEDVLGAATSMGPEG
jgi:HPt (histidine-containing phosphotransfer) domain-containing protein